MSKIKVLNALLSMDEDSLIYQAISLIVQDYNNFNKSELCAPVSTYAIELIKDIRLEYSTKETIEVDLCAYKDAVLNGNTDKMALIAAQLSLMIDKIKERDIIAEDKQ